MNIKINTETDTGRSHMLAIVISIIVSISTAITINFVLPDPSYADDLSTLMEEAKSLKNEIDIAKSEYLSAIQKQEEAELQYAGEQQTLIDIQNQLSDARNRLSKTAIAAYKTENDGQYLSFILNAETLSQALSSIHYLQNLAESRQKTVSEISELERQQAEIPEKLRQQEQLSVELAQQAEASQELFERKLEEIKPRIKQMRQALTDRLSSMGGSSQLTEILDYIDAAGNVTSAQKAIIQSAYRTGYAGGNRCEAWAEAVYRNAGFSVPNLMSAYVGWETYGIATNQENIPIGSWAYASGTSGPYSHVGIVVAEGMILDNEGAANGHTAVPMDQWLSWQTTLSWNNGIAGWFGWGHPDWIDFNDEDILVE